MNNYSQKYIDECRLKVNLQLSTYNDLIIAARKQEEANNELLQSIINSFESNFFNNMVIVLDHYFCHRSRTKEMKDGNPLNEVRILCNSIMNNNNMMLSDKTIKYVPAKSVLKYNVGDEVKLNGEDFVQLSDAFFAEMESKYL